MGILVVCAVFLGSVVTGMIFMTLYFKLKNKSVNNAQSSEEYWKTLSENLVREYSRQDVERELSIFQVAATIVAAEEYSKASQKNTKWVMVATLIGTVLGGLISTVGQFLR